MAESVGRQMALGFDVLHEHYLDRHDAHSAVEVAFRLPLTEDYLAHLASLCRRATTGPWRAVAQDTGDDWSVAWYTGTGDDMKNHAVTTDRIHASEVDGGAAEDAEFIAAARTAVPLLLLEIERQRALLAKGWER